jgi:hypothetical protein
LSRSYHIVLLFWWKRRIIKFICFLSPNWWHSVFFPSGVIHFVMLWLFLEGFLFHSLFPLNSLSLGFFIHFLSICSFFHSKSISQCRQTIPPSSLFFIKKRSGIGGGSLSERKKKWFILRLILPLKVYLSLSDIKIGFIFRTESTCYW